MGLSSISLAFVCTMVLAMTHFSRAQNSPQDYVDAHNAARAQVGVGPIAWDDTVAAFAQNYADQRADDCTLINSGGGGKYGENLATSSGDLMGIDAVNLWVAEKADYDYNTNSCVPGKQCRHYTQVVWRTSVRLGCARVQCRNGGWFVTCNYAPPGNIIEQRPYDASPEYSGNYLLTVGGGESGDYDCDTDSSARMEGKKSRHSQAVWRDSVQLGRASVLCTNGCYSVVCNYDPPGNYIGKRPYRLGQECSGNRLLVCRP